MKVEFGSWKNHEFAHTLAIYLGRRALSLVPFLKRIPEQHNSTSLRTQRADIAAIWCRRVAGLLVWGFVGIIISQLWTVAWKLRDLKLLALCLLITASLLYIFYKRYRHIRDIGLTGVDLVRAMTVDDGENGGLHGVTRKARASCVDFKFDPQATFQERPLGRGFERYPPPAEVMLPAAAPNSPGGGGGDDEEGKDSEMKRRRGIISWLWRWGRNVQEVSPGEDNESTVAEPGPVSDSGAQGEDNTSLGDLEIGRVGLSEEVGLGAGTGALRTVEAHGRSVASRAAEGAGVEAMARGNGMLGNGVGPRGRQGGQLVRASELNPSCSVCLFEYYLDEEVTLLPCGHLYHTECIDIWMRDHVDCPYCRADINVWATVGGGVASAAGAGDCPNRTSTAAAAAPASTVAGSTSSSPRSETRMVTTRSGLNASSSESNG